MANQTVIPFGPQHPVLPEPVHLDLVLEDEKVVDVIPQVGFVHRGLEKLVTKKDYNQFVYVTERICGICSFGHSMGYSQTVEGLMGVEIPPRAEYLRVILLELSRIHSHLLWLGLLADAFGYENLFMQSWRLRENILDIFERTTGGRVILSAVNVGGMTKDIADDVLVDICRVLDDMRPEYEKLVKVFLEDRSVKSRLVGVGVIEKEQAHALSMVGPFVRASGIPDDVRLLGHGAYGELEAFQPVISNDCDCYARCDVHCKEVFQSMDIIKELVAKIPAGEIAVKVKGNPKEGSVFCSRLEQPRGECYYYSKGNGTKFLERFRIRTPTSQNIAGMTVALKGCDLADVPMIILTIDPCISCTER